MVFSWLGKWSDIDYNYCLYLRLHYRFNKQQTVKKDFKELKKWPKWNYVVQEVVNLIQPALFLSIWRKETDVQMLYHIIELMVQPIVEEFWEKLKNKNSGIIRRIPRTTYEYHLVIKTITKLRTLEIIKRLCSSKRQYLFLRLLFHLSCKIHQACSTHCLDLFIYI